MKKVLLSLLVLYVGFSIAQVTYEKRIEFAVKDGYSNEEIYEFGNKGLMISSKKDDIIDGLAEWKYEFLNTDLEHVKTEKVLIGRKYYSDETFNTESRSHTLFKTKKGKFIIVSVDASTMDITKIEGAFPRKLRVWDMKIIGDYAIFDSQIKKDCFVMAVNWKTGKSKLIPIILQGYKSKNIYIQNIQLLEKTKEILVYVEAKSKSKKIELYVIKVNELGEKTEIFNFSEDITQNITSISASPIGENEYIFTGTYSTKSTSMSEGLFFSKVYNSKINFINFYNFLDLNDFLSYLPERKQRKIEKKHNKKKDKGKELIINYNVADHDVIVQEDGYVFIGECYYPTYRQESYQEAVTTTVNGVTTTRYVTSYRTVFDGYQYTHAVITKYSKEGRLIWDKTFEMWSSYKPFYVKRFISVAEENDETVDLVFISGGTRIYTKSIDTKNGDIIKDENSEIMETSYEGDKSKRSFSNVVYWYDHYFLAYGEQKIKNKKNDKVMKKRIVYFINKIGY